mmetsp:Transcript_80684/g.168264  ORF Transcript_80684/g.168264 Transcript_80684/m.168264 type:complete len:453 (-) Transcript_80684:92-1450(-)|eukprot:CAMPEP_0206473862 /NCGR_PEP_ID=MMETSP0324_2-20121206/33140_1 /ASSEMBLY_ACC=CAM_ASM_000836 /TAXON_ID=2866 /ORGANISM="Crypthecodinium cohnii, Strain Seligo" /LENGTH=452 /DNA_ID=CAMNT_0053948917 /DNA_START=163 /DNA_END=1521 /DNA_ORIENTATION=+
MGHDHGDHGKEGGHSHDHGHSHGHGHGGHGDLEAPLLGSNAGFNSHLMDEQRRLKQAVFFALFMMFVEIFGGILANSLAIITDAAHMLSDVGGFVVSLVCLQLASQGLTQEYTYGFKQAEVLGALLSIALVWALTACLLYEAFNRFYNLQEINAPYMFWISTLGFVVNLILMKVLGHGHSHGGGGHGHSHGGDHGEEEDEASSLAMRAAIAHVIGDIVQSLGVCVAALCIWFRPFDVGFTENGVSKWNYADPCCTVMFGILVLNTTKSTLTQTIDNLMVKAPEHIDQEKLSSKLHACPGVIQIHDLHVWTMGSNDVLLTAHLMIDKKAKDAAMDTLKAAIKAAQSMGVGHPTFQIEIDGEFDPALESYGFHENPCSPKDGDTKKDGHSHGGHDDHGHSHDDAGHKAHENGHQAHEAHEGCSGHSHSNGHSHGEPKKEEGHGHSHSGDHGHSH